MKIYVISLKKSLERRASIEQQMANYCIDFEFFDAIDGRCESPHPLFANYDYTKRLWFTGGKMPMKGELGCYASHYLLWKKSIELNEPIIILEDDAELLPCFVDFIDLIKIKVQEYGFLRLEKAYERSELFLKEKMPNYEIYFLSNNFGGARAYALSTVAAQKLIEGSQYWSMPVDNYMGSLYLHQMPSFLFSPSMVENPQKFETTFQNEKQTKAPLYRKPTRELYSLYRKLKMALANNAYKN
ncbi:MULTISPECIES: glycosyltransferase family 25 protein [Vibrio]|nr:MULTISPECIES: glycosyltransferase family 25 protein [Vibrio]MBY7668186.1 glycosyltransferase family 25 protein [Vibrio anguillarum]OXX47676.1 glycosyl transferase [Vibrio sp. V17_P4S1T151]OXX61435.1 glycosyl transferase [Vibrio sp. V15_P4S5T153]